MHKVSKIKKNRFSYKDILEVYSDLDYEALAILVEAWMAEEKITPIKASGKTSFRPSIYYEYKKLSKKQDYSMYEQEIKSLHPKLNVERYLKHPQIFAEHRHRVLMLSDYFWNPKSLKHEQMSVNEKSFMIWGDEKFLDSALGHKLLSFNHMNAVDLNYYITPEPFFTTICDWDFKNKSVLVIENKDSWYSLTKVLKTVKSNSLCGTYFGLLIYGEGNKATREGALTDYLRDFVKQDTDIYYIGDIDIAGIDILYRAMEKNSTLKLKPFIPIYKEMLKKAKGREMKKTEDHREKHYNKRFLEWFTAEEQEQIQMILTEEKRIPQEILTFPDYTAFLRDGYGGNDV